MGWAYATRDGAAEGIEAFRQALAATTENAGPVRLGLAYAFARAGQRDSALAYVAGADPESGYDVALVYFALGDTDRAFDVLERSLRANPGQLARMKYDPSAGPLRADPRFDALIRRLGLN